MEISEQENDSHNKLPSLETHKDTDNGADEANSNEDTLNSSKIDDDESKTAGTTEHQEAPLQNSPPRQSTSAESTNQDTIQEDPPVRTVNINHHFERRSIRAVSTWVPVIKKDESVKHAMIGRKTFSSLAISTPYSDYVNSMATKVEGKLLHSHSVAFVGGH